MGLSYFGTAYKGNVGRSLIVIGVLRSEISDTVCSHSDVIRKTHALAHQADVEMRALGATANNEMQRITACRHKLVNTEHCNL
jgi:hypothetical protein